MVNSLVKKVRLETQTVICCTLNEIGKHSNIIEIHICKWVIKQDVTIITELKEVIRHLMEPKNT